MLSELYIENLAVIKRAAIRFTGDFNVFTGETGAGKSILIGGINAVLGRRTSRDIVRAGCEKAVVGALFTELPEDVCAKLAEFGIDCPDDELYISREIYADGGSIARINHKTAAAAVVREIGALLIDIHGQHDGRILLNPESHIDILDGYAGLEEQIREYREEFRRLQETARTLKKLADDEREKQGRLARLKEIAEAIGGLGITDENEDERLEEEYRVASRGAELLAALNRADAALSGGDGAGAVELIGETAKSLAGFSVLEGILGRLESAGIELSDISAEIRAFSGKADIDEERYAFVLERRERLFHVKRKYGPSLKDALDTYRGALAELESFEDGARETERLNEEKKALLLSVTQKAEKLSELRGIAADEMVGKITEELKFLDMPNVVFLFDRAAGKLTQNGMDSIQMLISANAGEEPKPIAKIASGGELSRIMLAIKNVTAQKDATPTMIFDEIDSGVSGRAAQKVGVKLRQVSRGRQVLCVTHLPQIAVMADNHLLIEKKTEDGATETSVTALSQKERADEIARLLSGEILTETALKTAWEQLAGRDAIMEQILKNAECS